MITQHDESQKKKCRGGRIRDKETGKIFCKERSDQTQGSKRKRTYCCLFDALRVSPLRCVQTDCFAEPVSFSHDDYYSGQGLYVLSMMRATEEVLSPAREDCIP